MGRSGAGGRTLLLRVEEVVLVAVWLVRVTVLCVTEVAVTLVSVAVNVVVVTTGTMQSSRPSLLASGPLMGSGHS